MLEEQFDEYGPIVMNQSLYKPRSQKVGLPPGSLIPIGDKKEGPTAITLIEYDEKHFEERKIESIEQCLPLKEAPYVTWINFDSVHDPALLNECGKAFGLDALMLEDILNTDQRPKFEDLGNVLYVVLKMFDFDDKTKQIRTEQVSLVIGKNFVISFQEKIGDEFNPVRERLRANTKIRKHGADYLAYALIDTIVDLYFLVLEKLGETLEEVEERASMGTNHGFLKNIHHLRRELILLRKSIWPLREVINSLLHIETPLISNGTIPYLRDVYDHTIQVIDSVETYRDLLASVQELYLAVLSNRMNEIMKVLTVIATIFIPVTFIAGIYGMNFEYMPELTSPWGYPAIMIIMFTIITSELIFFKRKNWF